MRLGRTESILLGLALLVWAVGAMLYLRVGLVLAPSRGEREDLKLRGDVATIALTNLRSQADPAVLRQQLTALEEERRQLTAAGEVPRAVESVDILDLMVAAATRTGLDLITVTFIAPTTETVDGRTFPAVRYSVVAQGGYLATQAFLQQLERGPFSTLFIQTVSMEAGPLMWSIKLQIVVLGQPTG